MLIATYRDAEVRMSPRMSQLVGELGREGQLITLRGISEDDVRDFLEKTASQRPNPAMVTALHRVTEGNPFFLSEIVRLLIAEGRLWSDNLDPRTVLTIPDAVQTAIRRRLELISAGTRDQLEVAAVLGREFELSLLSIVSARPPDQILELLEEAMTAGIVGEVPSAIGRFRFSHTLVSETLYNGLSRSTRLRLHRQVAHALETVHRADPDPPLSELAYHHAQTLPFGDVAKAIEYAQRAAERATNLVSYEEAAELYRTGLKALDLLVPPDPSRRCLLQLGLGHGLYMAGQFREARVTFNAAAASARGLKNVEYLARAALGYALLSSNTAVVDLSKVELIEEALVGLDGDGALRAMLLARLAWELHWTNDQQRLESLSQQAVEIARRLDDSTTLVYVLIHRHLAIWGPQNLEERLEIATELQQLCEQPGNRQWAAQARYLRLTDLLELGEVEAADQEIEHYTALKDQRWLPFGYRERARALRALMQGRFVDSERLANEALKAGERIRGRALGAYNDHMYSHRRLEGRFGEIEESVRSVLEHFPQFTYSRCALALSYCALGRDEEARAEFELLTDNIQAMPRNSIWLQSMALLADVGAHLGNAERAKTLYQLLLPYSSRNIISDLNACYGSAHHYLGVLAATAGDFEQAQEQFEAALKFNRRMGAPPFVAWTQYEYARMLLKRDRHNDREQAFTLAQAAFKSASSMGIDRFAQRVHEVIVRCEGKDPPAVVLATVPRVGGHGFPAGRVLATITFLDIVDSTARAGELGDRRWGELMREYYAEVRRQLAGFGGREVNTFGDDFFALFDAPAEAVRCACAVRDVMLARGVKIRAGIHTGECDIEEGKVTGIAVHIGARVVRQAEPGEVVVSSTVRDLVAGADLRFSDRGVRPLRGVPGEWRLFAVEPGAASHRSNLQSPGAEPAAGSEFAASMFRREGDFWTVAYGGQVSRIRDAKGLAYIAHLLRRPGTEFHALDLMTNADFGRAADSGETAQAAASIGGTSDAQLAESGLHSGAPDDAGEMLDAKAKAAYHRRLKELQEQLEEAKELVHLESAEQVEDEIGTITKELRRAIALGGRDRRAASISERARLNVTRAIRAAMDRVTENNAFLGRHLAATIKIGAFCSYTPKQGTEICWEF